MSAEHFAIISAAIALLLRPFVYWMFALLLAAVIYGMGVAMMQYLITRWSQRTIV